MSEKEIQDLFTRGQFNELITQLSNQSGVKFTSQMYYILSLTGSDRAEEAHQHLDKLTIIPKNEIEEYSFFVTKLRVLYRIGRLNEFKTHLDSGSLLINKELSRVSDHRYLFWDQIGMTSIAMYHHIRGNFDEAYDYYMQSLEINRLLDNQHEEISLLISIGEVQMDRDDLDSATNYFLRSLQLSKARTNIINEAYANFNLGKISKILGKYRHAIEHLSRAAQIFTENSRTSGIVMVLSELGEIYVSQGDFTKAREYYDQCLNLSGELEYEIYKAISLHHLGHLNLRAKNYEIGITQFDEALAIWSKFGNDKELAHGYFDLIYALISTPYENKIDGYYSRLLLLKNNLSLISINHLIKLSEAIIAKSHSRIKEKVKAQVILENLLKEELSNSLRMSVLLEIVDIKLFELKTFEDSAIASEIESLLDKIWEISEKERLVPIQIEILFLRSKLSLIVNNFSQVNSYIEAAIKLADQSGLEHLSNRTNVIRDEIFDEIQKWNKMSDLQYNIRRKIVESRIMEYLEDVSQVVKDH